MKKITFLFIAMIINVGIFAQHSYKAVNYPIKDNLLEKPLQSTVSVFQQRNVLTTYFTEGFEGADFATLGWSTIDADGDTYDWAIQTNTSHTGTNCATSESWNSGVGALTPNNYLISPAIDLTSTTGTLFLEWWVRAQDQSWPSEHYKVLVSTTGTAQGDFTANLFEETVVAGGATNNKYVVRNVNLTAYAGQTIYLAFVHYNTTDMFRLDIDDVSIYNISTTDGSVTNVVSPNNTSTCQLTSSENVTVTIFNNGGLDIVDFPVSYVINGGATVTDTCTQTIAPASSYNFTFSSPIDVSALDIYSLYVYVTIPSDVNASNDAFDYQFVSSDAKITLNAHSDSLGGQSWWVIDNNSLDTFAVDYLGWQWNVDVIRNICVFNDSCYSVTVYDSTGMTATNVAYVELLYNDVQVAGSTTPGSFTGPELTANVGDGCATICFAPTNMSATSITTSSADLGWTAGGSDTLWNVEYGASGFTQGTGTLDEVSTNPYAISGLTSSTDYDFYVRAICGVGDTSSWAGPYTFATLISCPVPTNLSTSNITATSATLNWTNGGSETAWNIEYDISGFTQGTGTIVEVTSNPYIISGLTSATTYDFYVRAICGVGDTSSWAGPYAFATTCDATSSLPYTEGFEGATFPPTCWSVLDANSDLKTWISADATYANSGAKAASYSYSTTLPADDWLFTGGLNLQASTNYTLTFYYRARSATWAESLKTSIGTANNATAMTTTIVDLQGFTDITYVLSETNFTVPTTGVYYVGFQAYSDADMWNLYLDDVTIDLAPSCPKPTNLSAGTITTTSAILSWTNGGSETAWNIEYGAAGFTQGTGTAVNGVTNNPYTLSGLTSSTSYDFYVQADCGADQSVWVGPLAFGTASCLVTEQCDYTLDMTDSYGDGWNGAAVTILQNGIEVGTYSITDTTGTATIGLCDAASIELSWTAGSFPEECSFTLTDPFGNVVSTVADGSALTDGAVFNTFTSSCTPPACPAVTNLSAGTITTTSAILSWTNGGSETAWNVEYGVSGYTQGTGTTVAVTSNPYTLSGLTSSTAYDFYIQADCGADQSIWVGPFTFSTSCAIVNTYPWNESFEGGIVPPTCWSSVDTDGDTHNWEVVVDTDGYLIQDGSYAAMSASWDATDGALTPDNYLITPQFTIVQNNLEFKYWVGTQDGDWPSENYSVLVSTTGTATVDFTEIYNETLTADDTVWREVKLPLAAYNGQNIYLALRHWNSTDWYQMKIDNVSIDYTTSIAKIESNNISIYPNPTTGIVNIRTNENSNVYVYNVLGSVVASFNNLSNVSKINLSNLSEGNYVIKVVSDKESVNKHITIVK